MGRDRVMLLDTCALLWLAHQRENFSEEILKKMDEIPVLYVSAISAFEISLKYNQGKLILPAQPIDWFKTIVDHHYISIVDLNVDICIKATQLPQIHKDPCDRFIIATAMLYSIPVITGDEKFKEYGVQVVL
ncbi:MAG: type II toxin-antitoxin system VapC family toxin [Spirochaetes bacterium]|nr:type II toxin-antitoxin system VapC family toxin [Spirochaetota bacterium]